MKTKEYSYEDIVQVYCHTIKFWFSGEEKIYEDLKKQMKEEAIDRSKHDLNNECSSGELVYEAEGNNFKPVEYRGWWRIDR